jgi:predicted metal-dependent phosphoesterase TrpH
MGKMKIDIHTHSSYSDGLNTPEELIRHAKKIGLDGIAITDHNEIGGSVKALEYDSDEFMVIPGIEISADDGHILALNITEHVDRSLTAEETLDRVHELGGIAIAAHPYDRLRSGVGDLIYELNFDAVETVNGHTLSSAKDTGKIADELRMPKVGGSDAHCLDELGCVSIIVDNDPIESILGGDVEIVVDVEKLKLLVNLLRKNICRFL